MNAGFAEVQKGSKMTLLRSVLSVNKDENFTCTRVRAPNSKWMAANMNAYIFDNFSSFVREESSGSDLKGRWSGFEDIEIICGLQIIYVFHRQVIVTCPLLEADL